MKKILFAVVMMTLATVSVFAKGDWRGKVVDEKGEPVAYANVAVLSKADSTVVCGTVTEEDGTFNITTEEKDGIMMVAMLGYRTVYVVPVDGAVITLVEDSSALAGAVATAVMPKTKLTGEGLQTNVRGSVLENVGTANDVLARTPGLINGQNGLEVIGKGAPLVYINGRKVTDAGELVRLQSNEIQSVEVITNPGAQYDATVRAVVRIKTIRRQGDGFGFTLTASDAQSLRRADYNDPTANLNVNYRTGGVDIFAGVNYNKSHFLQISDAEKETTMSPVYLDQAALEGTGMSRSLGGNAGVNWQIADNHFMGGKVEWGRQLSLTDRTVINDKVSRDGVLVDDITTVTEDFIGDIAPYNVGTNVYYNGMVGEKLNIDFNAALLEQRWDIIFFTGSPSLGRIVMAGASKNLTPVVLELGGKSPCFVTADADIKLAAKRLAWGKALNAGQTCIAPDYVLIDKSIRDEFVVEYFRQVHSLLGEDPQQTEHFVRLVNDKAFERVKSYIDGPDVSGTVRGGRTDPDTRYIEPTVVLDPAPDSAVMMNEIFGPVLPVCTYESLDEAVAFVNGREKPLALYFFGKPSDGRDVVRRTSSGGACINDTIMHIVNEKVPFGGVGNSGMGHYHGKLSFDAFTHERAVITTPRRIDMPFRYMPYKLYKLFRRILG